VLTVLREILFIGLILGGCVAFAAAKHCGFNKDSSWVEVGVRVVGMALAVVVVGAAVSRSSVLDEVLDNRRVLGMVLLGISVCLWIISLVLFNWLDGLESNVVWVFYAAPLPCSGWDSACGSLMCSVETRPA
jgi:hypothetical protein